MYTTIGAMLCRLAVEWLLAASTSPAFAIALGLSGVILALGAYRAIFSRIVNKNIARVCSLPEKGCFFAFQAWKSYVLIAFMAGLGFTLRHSSFPKHYLAVIYLTIGGALFLASSSYYVCVWHRISHEEST